MFELSAAVLIDCMNEVHWLHATLPAVWWVKKFRQGKKLRFFGTLHITFRRDHWCSKF